MTVIDGATGEVSNAEIFVAVLGASKSHLAAAIGLALIDNGWRVLFTRTSELVQKLQLARRDLALESAIAKLDKYHLLILSARYERRSILITANQPFGEWGKIFPDPTLGDDGADRAVTGDQPGSTPGSPIIIGAKALAAR